MAISAATVENTRDLMQLVHRRLQELPVPLPEPRSIPVLRPGAEDENRFEIMRDEDEAWRVRGIRAERTAMMTDWDSDHGIARFQRILDTMGVRAALREAGVQAGDPVRFAEIELEWVD
jgi:GTP-binding protein